MVFHVKAHFNGASTGGKVGSRFMEA